MTAQKHALHGELPTPSLERFVLPVEKKNTCLCVKFKVYFINNKKITIRQNKCWHFVKFLGEILRTVPLRLENFDK